MRLSPNHTKQRNYIPIELRCLHELAHWRLHTKLVRYLIFHNRPEELYATHFAQGFCVSENPEIFKSIRSSSSFRRDQACRGPAQAGL
ncbi:hypothetical protein Sinac_4827 [Singulisphaera acidiphila DSM 18658]|uniref:Uncharacterized protein n=1 Tax=Singulisphaera acidiphila (strain ATCC BAA-1392 / DSM 18658 / VKM B-2454 / MOB10) TaxID=886293 RepID=L0DK19_SINAD|nr:hypothetical protein Sinac_4827 [Singulisphaera acidiphila DSM 18658]